MDMKETQRCAYVNKTDSISSFSVHEALCIVRIQVFLQVDVP
jgi:hypothetical protein